MPVRGRRYTQRRRGRQSCRCQALERGPATVVAMLSRVTRLGMSGSPSLQTGVDYYWREWCLVRVKDCLYIWSDAVEVELSNGSNG